MAEGEGSFSQRRGEVQPPPKSNSLPLHPQVGRGEESPTPKKGRDRGEGEKPGKPSRPAIQEKGGKACERIVIERIVRGDSGESIRDTAV